MPNLPLEQQNIIKMLGIESLPIDERQEIVMTAVELVETRTFNRILNMLDQEKKSEFAEALAAENVADFFEKNGISYATILEEETQRVKQELQEATKEEA